MGNIAPEDEYGILHPTTESNRNSSKVRHLSLHAETFESMFEASKSSEEKECNEGLLTCEVRNASRIGLMTLLRNSIDDKQDGAVPSFAHFHRGQIRNNYYPRMNDSVYSE
jgi:hypothetical protein